MEARPDQSEKPIRHRQGEADAAGRAVILNSRRMVPDAGFEPATFGLQNLE